MYEYDAVKRIRNLFILNSKKDWNLIKTWMTPTGRAVNKISVY